MYTMKTTHLGVTSYESDYVEILLAVSYSRFHIQVHRTFGASKRSTFMCYIIVEHSYVSCLFILMAYKKCEVLCTFCQLYPC